MINPDELARRAQAFAEYLPDQSSMPAISRDYARIQNPLMWGGIWQAPGLDLNLRSLATISAQCVNGWDFGLQHQIRVGLTMSMSPQKIKGIFIQLLFYAGIPATVFGLLQAQKVIDANPEWQEADVPLETNWLDTLEEKLQRASEIRRRLWGEQADREVEGSLSQRMVPEASDIVDGYNFGEVWGRPDLEPKERMVCVLAALTARRHLGMLRQYIGYALNMEFTQREICEIIAQAGWYRGWPHVEDALEQAKSVFEVRGLEV
ncbi:MAG: carboxymuconolactone decarboxylase family protein [Dehalococcoidia bacterium]